MANLADVLPGAKFGKLTVIETFRKNVGNGKRGGGISQTKPFARCVCECGGSWEGLIYALGKHTNSCGCAWKSLVTTHGLTTDPFTKRIYALWQAMMHRCYDEKRENYNSYGGRGIQVEDAWRNDPVAFVEWAKANGYAPGLSLDRVDPDKNYGPGNCRWATAKQQARNRRTGSRITAWGETKLLCEWMEDPRVTVKCRRTVFHRISRGWWEPEMAFTTTPGAFGTRPLAFRVAPTKAEGKA